MNTSEQCNDLYKALSIAQGEIQNPSKDAINPHFKSHYADLSGGINAIRAALANNGLSIVQITSMRDDVLMLTTRVCHSSGQWLEGEYPVCKFPSAPQIAGSAMTYARRYALFAIVGIAGEDDDGETANQSITPAATKKPFVRAVQDKFPGAREMPRDEIPFQDDPRGELSPSISEYTADAMETINKWSSNAVALWEWWKSEAPHRESVGIKESSTVFNELYIAMSDKGKAIKGATQ